MNKATVSKFHRRISAGLQVRNIINSRKSSRNCFRAKGTQSWRHTITNSPESQQLQCLVRLCGSALVLLSQTTATRNNSNNSKATGYQNVSRQGLVTEEQIRGLKYSPCSVRSENCHRMASPVNQMVLKGKKKKNLPSMQETHIHLWVGKIPWRRECLPTPIFLPGEFYRLMRKKSKCAC